jgi:hypothetical protein
MIRFKTIIILLFIGSIQLNAQQLRFGLLKYNGGGDWYANPTALPNLARFCNKELNMNLNPEYQEVDPSSIDIFNFPFIHMTGHGNVFFSEREARNIREYLLSGGFLHIDDNYGMNEFIQKEIKKIFPDKSLIELPFSHAIYHQKYEFNEGLPKIHRHDGNPPQGFAILHNGRVVLFYSYESDLGDGWEDTSVHNDSPEKHMEALKMGANIIQYALHN